MLETPPIGKIWVLEAIKINKNARKNVGMLIKINEKRDMPLSMMEYLLTEEIKARGMVISHKNIMTTKERYKVFKSLCFIKVITGI